MADLATAAAQLDAKQKSQASLEGQFSQSLADCPKIAPLLMQSPIPGKWLLSFLTNLG